MSSRPNGSIEREPGQPELHSEEEKRGNERGEEEKGKEEGRRGKDRPGVFTLLTLLI